MRLGKITEDSIIEIISQVPMVKSLLTSYAEGKGLKSGTTFKIEIYAIEPEDVESTADKGIREET